MKSFEGRLASDYSSLELTSGGQPHYGLGRLVDRA